MASFRDWKIAHKELNAIVVKQVDDVFLCKKAMYRFMVFMYTVTPFFALTTNKPADVCGHATAAYLSVCQSSIHVTSVYSHELRSSQGASYTVSSIPVFDQQGRSWPEFAPV